MVEPLIYVPINAIKISIHFQYQSQIGYTFPWSKIDKYQCRKHPYRNNLHYSSNILVSCAVTIEKLGIVVSG